MTGFLVKELDDRSLGQTLRSRREERGETLDDVERATQVAKKYLAAFEQNDFKKLPEAVYARKFARAIARHYGLDADGVVEGLLKEMTAVTGPVGTQPVNFVHGRTLLSTPLIVKSALLACGFLAIAGYFAFSVHKILKPPEVVVFAPRDDQSFSTGRVAFEGRTEPEVELTVNSEQVPIEADGTFKEILMLPPGVSHLRVAARKKHSRENELYLKVVVDEPTLVASATAAAIGGGRPLTVDR